MTRQSRPANPRAVLTACWFTALLNALFATTTTAQEATTTPTPDLAEKVLHCGPLDIRPTINAGVMYDDNIYIQPRNKEGDVIWNLSPGISLDMGDYRVKEANLLTLDYAPSFFFFQDNDDNNAVDQDVQLAGQWHPGNWTFGVRQEYQAYSGAVLDVGNRVNRKIYTTSLSSKYELSPKTSLELDGFQTINDYERLISYNEWVAQGWADYGLTPLVKIGAGLSAGFVDIDRQPNQTYQQLLTRVAYTVTEKSELRASAGAEMREFERGQSTRFNGVFSGGVVYRPFGNTTFSFDAYRRDQNSVILAGQNYTTTGFSVGLEEVIRVKYRLLLASGYENAEYHPVEKGVTADRQDNYFFVKAGLNWNVTDRFVTGVFYMYRQDDSNSDRFGFNDNQVGVSASYRF